MEIEEPDLDYLIHEECPDTFDIRVVYMEQDELVRSQNADILAMFNISKCLGIAAVNPRRDTGFMSHAGLTDLENGEHGHIKEMKQEIENPGQYEAYIVVGNDTPDDFTSTAYQQMAEYFGEDSVNLWLTDPDEEKVQESSLAIDVNSGICLRYEPSEEIKRKSKFPSA